MSRRLTISLCCNTAFAIANFRTGVIRHLLAQGHRVVAIAPPDDYVPTLEALGVECVPWQLSARSTGLLSEWGSLQALTAIYRRIRPDLAFHYTIKSVIYGAIAARRTGTPFVSVITGLGYVFLNDGWISRTARWLYARTLRWSREVWFLNADDADAFDREGLTRGVTVRRLPGEGVDMAHFAPAPLPCAAAPQQRRFLMIARLLRDKGVLELIEAARTVRQRHPGARFQLLGAAGDANPTAIGQAEVDAWVAEGVVEHLGVLRDVRPAIAAADCVVLPSYREGAPRSLMEAAAMQRPIVATDVPGCRDVVADGRSGWLCRARDAGDLAAKLMAACDADVAALEAMGREGRRLVGERFDERLVIALYDRLVASLASAAPAAGRR